MQIRIWIQMGWSDWSRQRLNQRFCDEQNNVTTCMLFGNTLVAYQKQRVGWTFGNNQLWLQQDALNQRD
jgi:hypothetical protein